MDIRVSRRPSAARQFFKSLARFMLCLAFLCSVMAYGLAYTDVIDQVVEMAGYVVSLVLLVLGGLSLIIATP